MKKTFRRKFEELGDFADDDPEDITERFGKSRILVIERAG
jgi:hypothetical protein